MSEVLSHRSHASPNVSASPSPNTPFRGWDCGTLGLFLGRNQQLVPTSYPTTGGPT